MDRHINIVAIVAEMVAKHELKTMGSHSSKLTKLLLWQNSNLLITETNTQHLIWPCPLKKQISCLVARLLHLIPSTMVRDIYFVDIFIYFVGH